MSSFTCGIAKRATYEPACTPKRVLARYGKYYFSKVYHLGVFFEVVVAIESRHILFIYGYAQNFQTIVSKVYNVGLPFLWLIL